MITSEQIKELLKVGYGIGNYSVQDLGGHTDKIYKINAGDKRFVLKISMNRKMTKRLFVSQLHYIEYLRKLGFKSPAIIRTKDGNSYSKVFDYKSRWSILFEFIDNIDTPNFEVDKNVISFAKYIGNIH